MVASGVKKYPDPTAIRKCRTLRALWFPRIVRGEICVKNNFSQQFLAIFTLEEASIRTDFLRTWACMSRSSGWGHSSQLAHNVSPASPRPRTRIEAGKKPFARFWALDRKEVPFDLAPEVLGG
jgi:hypothetical protein